VADEWEVVAVGPAWQPAPGSDEVAPAPGRLLLHEDALVFRADDGTETAIPIADIKDAGPLSPGARITPSRAAGQWMAVPLRRLRCPGFAVITAGGTWVFDAPHGVRRARAVRERYAG
jgi:hypothetical protein